MQEKTDTASQQKQAESPSLTTTECSQLPATDVFRVDQLFSNCTIPPPNLHQPRCNELARRSRPRKMHMQARQHSLPKHPAPLSPRYFSLPLLHVCLTSTSRWTTLPDLPRCRRKPGSAMHKWNRSPRFNPSHLRWLIGTHSFVVLWHGLVWSLVL